MGIASARPATRLSRLGLALALAAPLAVLSACDEETYPTAANTEAPPPAQPQELMGAPGAPPPSAEAPPVTAEGPPPYAPPWTPPPQASMAPIPNPGEAGAETYYEEGRVHGRYGREEEAETFAPSAPAPLRHHHRRFRIAPFAHAGLRGPAGPAEIRPQTQVQAPLLAEAPPAHAPAPLHRAAPRSPASGAAAVYPGARPGQGGTASPPASAAAETAPRLEALRTALAGDLTRSAVLAVPGALKADVPVDVSLTVPEGFFARLRDRAGAEGLNDEAASASLTSQLSGQGYGIMPAEPQTQPLASGRATVFHWVVTPAAGPRTPLTAKVSAHLLGGGDQALDLGAVQAGPRPGGLTLPRLLGAGLLILVGAGVLAWLFRSRPPAYGTSAFARRNPSRPPPPLDLTPDAPNERRI